MARHRDSLAVIVPTANPIESLHRTLSSIVDLAEPAIKTIVVQNGITPNSTANRRTLERFASLDLQIVHEPIPGLLAGRHRGIRESNSEIVALIDDDVALAPTWFSGLLEAFGDLSVSMVGGPSRPVYACPPPEWFDQLWSEQSGIRTCIYLSLMDAGIAPRDIAPEYIWGLNLAIRRDALFRLGGFHPDGVPWEMRRYRGDGETGLSDKFSANDLKARYHPKVSVEHFIPENRLTIESVCRRAYLQGISNSYTEIRRAGRLVPADRTPWLAKFRESVSQLKRSIRRGELTDRLAVASRLQDAARKGYQYHQAEVAADPKLFGWVTQETYWDYSYPSGGGS